ncbi:MAG: hypothetical protein K5663_00285 [Clostridiales bacterium]|nr:hypothetical protein [Clostridiales bacterium]
MKLFIARAKAAMPVILKTVWNFLTRRLWLKLLSLLLALILWTYIVSSTPSLTRTKTIENVSVTQSGANVLSAYTLAVSTDVFSVYQNYVDVSVTVPQSQYSQLTARNIRVTPDYTGIRTPGTYDVPLVATSAYGTVSRISPATISVTIENLESRVVSVEPEFWGEDTENYWYGEASATLNPQQINVSGPASIVSQVKSIRALVDVSGRGSIVRKSATAQLLDAEGNVLSNSLLTRSSSTCYVVLEVYPKKALDVSIDTARLRLKEGYQIDSVTFQPGQISVAGSPELLDALDYLPLDVPDFGEISSSFTATLSFSELDEFRYVSAKSVYMSVSVSEKNTNHQYTSVPVILDTSGLKDGLDVINAPLQADVTLSGPYSQIASLDPSALTLRALVSADAPGEVTVPVQVLVNGLPDGRFELDETVLILTVGQLQEAAQ